MAGLPASHLDRQRIKRVVQRRVRPLLATRQPRELPQPPVDERPRVEDHRRPDGLRPLLTVKEAADYLKKTPHAAWQFIRLHGLRVKVGNDVRVYADELAAVLETLRRRG